WRKPVMLLLTKLDKTRVLVTLETIKYVEETPDTLIRFLNGESILVRESLPQITTLADEMYRRVHSDSGTNASNFSNQTNAISSIFHNSPTHNDPVDQI
ncbi:MAG: flagellar FlbD family protein, partial [Proteobacteria bacterium]|nr:flagellar FlbD family protein [Pseudomonadota bacterium]